MGLSQQNRVDALLNEYKGNFFEFLVCKSFAQKFNLETDFYSLLNQSLFVILQQQETFLRENYRNLLIELPKLADDLVSVFSNEFKIRELSKILLIGKSNTSGFIADAAEGDILLASKDVQYNISLKLTKHNVFVNTKSAGIKTFFTKYFTIEDASSYQDKFNQFVDMEFEALAIKLHEMADLQYTHLFTEWEKNDLAVLPGQLEGDFKSSLLEYYSKVTNEIYEILLSFYELDPICFALSLKSLLGFSTQNVIQVQANYKGDVEHFSSTSIDIHTCPGEIEVKDIILKNRIVEIALTDRILQIRLKPMNKFTNSAYKVNCSIKFN